MKIFSDGLDEQSMEVRILEGRKHFHVKLIFILYQVTTADVGFLWICAACRLKVFFIVGRWRMSRCGEVVLSGF